MIAHRALSPLIQLYAQPPALCNALACHPGMPRQDSLSISPDAVGAAPMAPRIAILPTGTESPYPCHVPRYRTEPDLSRSLSVLSASSLLARFQYRPMVRSHAQWLCQ